MSGYRKEIPRSRGEALWFSIREESDYDKTIEAIDAALAKAREDGELKGWNQALKEWRMRYECGSTSAPFAHWLNIAIRGLESRAGQPVSHEEVK